MKIIFEAQSQDDLLSVVRAFAELVTASDCINPADQKLLDDSLHAQKRLAKRIEKLDALFPTAH